MKKRAFPKIRISIPFVLLVALLYVMDFGSVFFITFAAVFLHELAHILAVYFCGGNIELIDVCLFGIRVNVPELRFMSYRKEIIIAAAGPTTGIITAAVGFATARIFNISFLDYFIGVNIAISCINLIPVYPLDGGRIIMAFSLKYLPVRGAYFICYLFSIISITLLFALCVYLAINSVLNPSLVIFAVYVAVAGFKLPCCF